MYLLRFLRPEVPPLLPLLPYSTQSLSFATSTAYLAPTRLGSACSHHRIPTCAPGALSDPSHRSNIDQVAMYCATVVWCLRMFSSITNNPTSSLSVAVEVYVHLLSGVLRGSRPVNRLATWA